MQHPQVNPSLAPYGFVFPRSKERLTYVSPNESLLNVEKLLAKFWARRHRKNAPRPLPVATILHEILPGRAAINRLYTGDFIWDEQHYLSRDIALLSTVVQWFGTSVGSCFLETNILRIPCPHPEREFVMKFAQETESKNLIRMWTHVCSTQCEPQPISCAFGDGHYYEASLTPARDLAVVEGLMFWLGTKAGRVFIAEWLERKKQSWYRARRMLAAA